MIVKLFNILIVIKQTDLSKFVETLKHCIVIIIHC